MVRRRQPCAFAVPSYEVVVVHSLIRVFIVAGVRFYRDGLADIIARHSRCTVSGTASSRLDAVERIRETAPDIVLLDAAMAEGLLTAADIVSRAPSAKVVAIALDETPHAVLEWAEAGVSGYVPRDASLTDLIAAIERTARDELQCSVQVAAGMIRRVWALAKVAGDRVPRGSAPLTPREREIVRLIEQGMSNKDIARHLGIGVATAKSHVHHILEKLHVRGRSQAAARMRQIG
jgi:two-component system, NarL family, nitrate/nitrite response regulator NarL